MKSVFIYFSILMILLANSCRKDETVLSKDSYVKSYESDDDIYLVSSFQLDDGNYLIASSAYSSSRPGEMLKIDAQGKKIWRKPLSPLVLILWKAIPVPGQGFLAFGIQDINATTMYLCMYDNDGNLLTTDSILSTLPNFGKTPFNIIRLSNGNFMVVGGTSAFFNYHYIYVRVLKPDLNPLSYYQLTSPDANRINICHAVCELPDASVRIAATVSHEYSEIKNLLILKTNLNGTLISSTYLKDTIFSESADAIMPYKGGMLAITSKMRGFSFGFAVSDINNDGMAVNYDNSQGLKWISYFR